MDRTKTEEEIKEELKELEEQSEESSQPVDEAGPEIEEEVEEPVKVEQQQEIPKKLEQEVKQIGAPVPGRLDRLKAFIMECKRVLRVTKKPDKQEFSTIVKISAIGMAIMGVVGFLIHFIKELLF